MSLFSPFAPKKKPNIWDMQGTTNFGAGLPTGPRFGIGSGPGGPTDPNATPPAPAQPQSWMDGGKFGWKDGVGLALGAFSDAMSTARGGAPMFQQQMYAGQNAKRAAAAAEEAYNRQRADRREDTESDRAWQLANRPVPRNDMVEDLNAYMSWTPEQKAAYDQMRPVVIQGAQGPEVVSRPSLGQQSPPQGPQPGTIEDGFRFKGGDPGDQRNWEPVAAPMASSSPNNSLPPGITPGSPAAYEWLRRTTPRANFPMGSPLSRRPY
jgi:hypothetical protein